MAWTSRSSQIRTSRSIPSKGNNIHFIDIFFFSFLFFHLIYEEDEIFKSLATCLTFEMWGVGYFLGVPAEIVNTEKTTVTTTGRILILLVSVDGGGELGSYLITTETQ